jgi:hypothetical protein
MEGAKVLHKGATKHPSGFVRDLIKLQVILICSTNCDSDQNFPVDAINR